MRTKIIATIGPASESYEMLYQMIEAGLDIARINFSHCTYEEYRLRRDHIYRASAQIGKKVYILQDLQGPRIRVGVLPPEGIRMEEEEVVVFSTNKDHKDAIYIDNSYLHVDIQVGDPLFLANGELELVVQKTEEEKIYAKVIQGGVLQSRKGVNVPHTKLTSSGLTDKDIKDVTYALSVGVDYIAASFVQSAQDMHKLRDLTKGKALLIAKIETGYALKYLDEIIQASDAIMIARGDLGIEIPVEELPFVQKNLIRHAAWHKKGSITATQMLTSMITHPHPTRAEVSDTANAVWDGTDAVMLSDETASGRHPLEALKTIVKIVSKAEDFYFHKKNYL